MHSQTMKRNYLPAAGRDWALPLYDPMVKLLGGDSARRALMEQAALRPRDRVLDIGCGTGTLATLIKSTYPAVEVVGLDPDPKALARSIQKAQQAGLSIRFDHGFADDMPYAAASFDHVFSSFMFHHLPGDQRGPVLQEVRRVLAPGGALHLADFERPEKGSGGVMRWLHSSSQLQDNSEDRMLALMKAAGFAQAERVRGKTLLFGLLHVGYYRASAAAA